jgi:hypothetical protein
MKPPSDLIRPVMSGVEIWKQINLAESRPEGGSSRKLARATVVAAACSGSSLAEVVPETVSPEIEAQKAMRAFTNPTAPKPGDPPAPTYKQTDQKELDRILNNQR